MATELLHAVAQSARLQPHDPFVPAHADAPWDFAEFKKGFGMEVTKITEDTLCFDMWGIDPSLANALRRIVIAEVPTVAISEVIIYQNTGAIYDENLAHRLGLLPLVFNPDDLEWRPNNVSFDDSNSLTFKLQKFGDKKHLSVYSRDLEWVPVSEEQHERFKASPPRFVADDILVAQLAAGQEIELICHCEKGIGKQHVKWSPVSAAFYRINGERFHFTIETAGQLPVDRLLERALAKLKEKSETTKANLEKGRV